MDLKLGTIPILRRKLSIQKLPNILEEPSCSLWIEPSPTNHTALFRGRREHSSLETGQLWIYQYPIYNGNIPQKAYRLILQSIEFYRTLAHDQSVCLIEQISKENQKTQAKDMVFLEANRIFHIEGDLLLEELEKDQKQGTMLKKRQGEGRKGKGSLLL